MGKVMRTFRLISCLHVLPGEVTFRAKFVKQLEVLDTVM
jgi:hypothetical protein